MTWEDVALKVGVLFAKLSEVIKNGGDPAAYMDTVLQEIYTKQDIARIAQERKFVHMKYETMKTRVFFWVWASCVLSALSLVVSVPAAVHNSPLLAGYGLALLACSSLFLAIGWSLWNKSKAEYAVQILASTTENYS